MLDPQLITSVLGAWKQHQAKPHRTIVQRPLPDAKSVKELLETVYVASQRREEGKPIHISITLADASDVETHSKSMAFPSPETFLKFAVQIPFSVENLLKLGPAFPRTRYSFAVACNSSASLAIWGVFLFYPHESPFDVLPVGVENEISMRPDFFTAASMDIGVIAISRGNDLIGEIKNDFATSTVTVFNSRSLAGYLATLPSVPKWQCEDLDYIACYLMCIKYLLGRISKVSHGSTLVLLPRPHDESSTLYTPRNALSPPLGIEYLMQQLLEEQTKERAEKNPHLRTTQMLLVAKRKKLLRQRLDAMATLACIDGALICTSALDAIAFGARLTAPKTSRRVITAGNGRDANGGEPFDISRYGTRHNSAVDFADASSASVTFVMSTDGPIRAFSRMNTNDIHFWDCKMSISLGDLDEFP